MIDIDEDDESFMDERFAEVKQRFVAGLPQRLAVAFDALNRVEGDSASAAEAVAVLYETVHSMCGMAPMLGFAALGDAARKIDNALVTAFRAKRGLGSGEIEPLRRLLQTLDGLCRVACLPRETAVPQV